MNAFNRLFIPAIFCDTLSGLTVQGARDTREEVSNSPSILSCPFRPIDTKNFSYALSSILGAHKQPYARRI